MVAGLRLEIDRDGEAAIYEQIVDGIGERIESGRLPPGSRLPTVRELAEELSLARVTVHKAYAELRERGLIDATVGRGTFVVGPAARSGPADLFRSPQTPEAALASAGHLSRARHTHSLAIAEPDPDLYPAGEFMRIINGLTRESPSLFGYAPPQGDPALRFQISSRLARQEIDAAPEEILITLGNTQGLAMVAQALARPGDKVLVEQPTFFGFLAILRSLDLQPLGVPMDTEGPDPDSLQRLLLRERPRFFYTIPSFHNPMGICMSPRRRKEILALAERYGLVLVEDDILHQLSYDRPYPGTLKADDPGDLVVYLDSFSKTLLPGLRLGFICAPPPLREKLSTLLYVNNLGAPPLLQRALAEFLRRGLFEKQLKRVLPHYKERRDALQDGLKKCMPAGTTWTRPRGGFCCWVTLPRGGSYTDLHRATLQQGVAYTPGEVFLTRPGNHDHLRLCFGGLKPAAIRESLAVLGKLVKERLGQATLGRPGLARSSPLV